MRLKSFHGPTMTDAMRLVRGALGDDAIIVATREEDGGVRVTAAIEDATVPRAPSPADAPLAPPPREAPGAKGPRNASTSSTPRDETDAPDGTDILETIANALTRHRVPSWLADKLMAAATQFAGDDPLLALGAACDAHFRFQPVTMDRAGKPLILIGPPGAGKTLSVAKFATLATLGKRAVTVVSADVERAGGMEQLAAFTRLLKLNLLEIDDAPALRSILQMQVTSHVFIDTPGGNPFDPRERDLIGALASAAGGEAIVTLPAGLDPSEAIDLAGEFQTLGGKRLLVTRLDMARRLGGTLRIAAETKLPLANYAASSKVIDAPQPLNPVALARLILGQKADG